MATKSFSQANEPAPANEPWFGLYRELGKTEARQSFLHLLNKLKDESSSVAITDRGEKVAVIMGYKQFQILMSILKEHGRCAGENPLAGLIVRAGDLEKGKAAVDSLFQESLRKTSETI